MEAQDGRFLAAVLRCAGGENASHLSYESALQPELASGIQKLTHLAAHVAEACRGSEDERVSVDEIVQGRDRNVSLLLPGLDGSHLDQDFVRQRFWHLP